jgi:hypothetical protein
MDAKITIERDASGVGDTARKSIFELRPAISLDGHVDRERAAPLPDGTVDQICQRRLIRGRTFHVVPKNDPPKSFGGKARA